MTGQWSDDRIEDEYWLLEYESDIGQDYARRKTGEKSKASFQKLFGQHAYMAPEDYERFERDWPYMGFLDSEVRPRCRWMESDCHCDCGCMEITMLIQRGVSRLTQAGVGTKPGDGSKSARRGMKAAW